MRVTNPGYLTIDEIGQHDERHVWTSTTFHDVHIHFEDENEAAHYFEHRIEILSDLRPRLIAVCATRN